MNGFGVVLLVRNVNNVVKLWGIGQVTDVYWCTLGQLCTAGYILQKLLSFVRY